MLRTAGGRASRSSFPAGTFGSGSGARRRTDTGLRQTWRERRAHEPVPEWRGDRALEGSLVIGGAARWRARGSDDARREAHRGDGLFRGAEGLEPVPVSGGAAAVGRVGARRRAFGLPAAVAGRRG